MVVKNKQREIILHCLYNLAAVSLATGLSVQMCHYLEEAGCLMGKLGYAGVAQSCSWRSTVLQSSAPTLIKHTCL